MNPVEITIRIQRDELLRLLDTMTPEARQTITTRSRISDIDAELARQRPFSQVAALLAPCSPRRPLLVRAKTQPGAPAVPPPAAVIPEVSPPPPAEDVVDIHSSVSVDHGHSIELTARAPAVVSPRFNLVPHAAAACLLVLLSLYFLI